MNSFVISQIRTLTPIAVGALISWLTLQGVQIDNDAQLALAVGITGLLQGGYYLLARLLEKQFPQLGFLLGSPKQPNYKEIK